MQVPVAKPYLTEDDAHSAYETVLSGWVTQGPRVREFEEKFALCVGAKYAVAVSSCTTALHLAMIVAGIRPGDEVICPSMSFIATANSIRYVGANPVFAEIDPKTYNIDPVYTEKLISDKTKAILIVHQLGMPADIDKFKGLCKKYRLVLIEDAACAIGSIYKGKRIGSHSDLVCFSFHPRKIITTGDGGMITTSNEEYYKRFKLLRQHGMSVDDRLRHLSQQIIFEEYTEIGYNYRMTDIQASIGIKQLEKLDWIVSERRRIATKYRTAFQNVPCICLPEEDEGFLSNYQSYSIRLKDNSPISRNELMDRLLDKGISTRRGVMTAHREPAYYGVCSGLKLPISEDISDSSIIIPLYIPMSDEEVDFVIGSIKDYLQ